ncbi:hypothetical protein [Cohnella sp. GbtcB17]|uniref:hypothetical protein n=1 Tax=Cohnella sp. GbtcB17 TaxID=2824762 RepID=UPI001C2F8FCA|nr:hypothetical protein [Cohnella sp. GbtcB17]
MKMAAFIMGGLAGAALTVAIRRSPRWSVAAGMLGRELKNRSFGMKEGALGKMFDMRFSADHSERKGESGSEGYKRSASKKSDSDSLGELAGIVSKDPGVREEVNEILAESGQHRI